MTLEQSKKLYNATHNDLNLPVIEQNIIEFWQKNNIFQQSVGERQAGKTEYIFYDGPPFANGLPHYGHLLTGYAKDVVARYQTQQGKRVERRFGWDCHGLPAEMGAEKELGISGRLQILDYGIDKFNEVCATNVMKYAHEWEYYVTRQARWVDFEGDYKTMDLSYMKSIMWAFKALWDKGFLYESYRVMPYSWAAETPLSNFETRLDNAYRERADKAVTVAFELEDVPEFLDDAFPNVESAHMLAWTTTPWTLPSNLALAVGEEMEYVAIFQERDNNKNIIIIAKFALNSYKKELDLSDELLEKIHGNQPDAAYQIIKGKELTEESYIPLFPYFEDTENAFRILSADFVEEGSGTGVVHLAPGFGEDDQLSCAENGIERVVCPVDSAGKFTDEVSDFAGLQVFDANEPIIRMLKEKGRHLKTEQYIHNYPHCWRTDQPLIYKAVSSWYVRVSDFASNMLENNKQINWIPEHIKEGLFGKWLEGARDWSISRNRFWGAPIPVWRNDNPELAESERIKVFGSIAELEEFFGVDEVAKNLTDEQGNINLHRPYIDNLTKPCEQNSKYSWRRVEDVLDCWFESGSMPFAQHGYPFDNAEKFSATYPAQFIVEYTAQTRGWFYTLMVMATAMGLRYDDAGALVADERAEFQPFYDTQNKHGLAPFQNCICHGVVLAEDGQKLSKRLQNYPDPKDIFDKYGADALRWFMMSSAIMRGDELYIDKEGKAVRDVLRLVIKPIWNAYHFFVLYANADADKIKRPQLVTEIYKDKVNLLDQYILLKLEVLANDFRTAMDSYNTPKACEAVENFTEVLNNWYIRRSRARFWSAEASEDKQSAYDTLYTVLDSICKITAPLLPCLAEEVWQGLSGSDYNNSDKSVHLCDYPAVEFGVAGSADLIADMERVRDACSAALAFREKQKIRIRQPLAEMLCVGDFAFLKADNAGRSSAYQELIIDEINVKRIIFAGAEEEPKYATRKVVLDFKKLGARLGKDMKAVAAAVKQGDYRRDGAALLAAGQEIAADEFNEILEPIDADNTTATDDGNLVILDTNITTELAQEGIARDLVRLVQEGRKNAGLEITDKIRLQVSSENAEIMAALQAHQAYIAEQVLAEQVHISAQHPEHELAGVIDAGISKDTQPQANGAELLAVSNKDFAFTEQIMGEEVRVVIG